MSLTSPQKEALLLFTPHDFRKPPIKDGPAQATLKSLVKRGLIEQQAPPPSEPGVIKVVATYAFRLTEEGARAAERIRQAVVDKARARPKASITDKRPWLATGRCRIDDLLTWVYRDQQADRRDAGGRLYEGEASAAGLSIQSSSTTQILEYGVLGCRVDSSPSQGFDIDPLAASAHAWVRALRPAARGIVVSCARAGGGPALPRSYKPRIEPVQWKDNARTRAVHIDSTQYDAAGKPYYVPRTDVIVSNTKGELMGQYEHYKEWALSLNCIADMLRDGGEVAFELSDVALHTEIRTAIDREAVVFRAGF